MPSTVYFRFPALSGDTIAFVSEDDLWTVPADGGIARRLTRRIDLPFTTDSKKPMDLWKPDE